MMIDDDLNEWLITKNFPTFQAPSEARCVVG